MLVSESCYIALTDTKRGLAMRPSSILKKPLPTAGCLAPISELSSCQRLLVDSVDGLDISIESLFENIQSINISDYAPSALEKFKDTFKLMIVEDRLESFELLIKCLQERLDKTARQNPGGPQSSNSFLQNIFHNDLSLATLIINNNRVNFLTMVEYLQTGSLFQCAEYFALAAQLGANGHEMRQRLFDFGRQECDYHKDAEAYIDWLAQFATMPGYETIFVVEYLNNKAFIDNEINYERTQLREATAEFNALTEALVRAPVLPEAGSRSKSRLAIFTAINRRFGSRHSKAWQDYDPEIQKGIALADKSYWEHECESAEKVDEARARLCEPAKPDDASTSAAAEASSQGRHHFKRRHPWGYVKNCVYNIFHHSDATQSQQASQGAIASMRRRGCH